MWNVEVTSLYSISYRLFSTSISFLQIIIPPLQDIFRRIFLSNCWWQKSDIWSQASYRYIILWEAFLDPSDSYFLFADLVGFYTHWTYMHIFRRIFLSNYWWQESDIWSQASYRYAILWEAFLDPSDTYFLFADLVGFYTHWTYMHIFRHIFLSNYWWQRSDIWSQASYRYPISWEAFFDSSDSYFLFAEERGYHKWALAHSSSCFKMSAVVYMYCEIIIINHGVLIFVDSVVHLNHKNENATKCNFSIDCCM